jgi:hypothetical protein
MRFAPLVFAPALLFATEAKQTCPLPLVSPRLQQEAAYHAASLNAERIAPSAVTSTGRRRATPPPPVPAAQFPATVNFIDSDLFAAMKAANIGPAPLAGDEEFLRRVSLDLTGQIPDSAAVTAFLSDKSADKRTKKIDELLSSDGFTERWTMWFGDLVQNVQVSSNAREYYLGRNAYYTFIRDSISAGKPYDQMVREVLSTRGDSFVNGAADYVVRQMQPNGPIQDTYDNLAAHSGEKFLGMPLLCLSCHSGPGHLELVNQSLRTRQRSEFWGMAAFFARTRAVGVKYTDPANPNANIVKYDVQDNPTGGYTLNTVSGNKTPRQPAAGQPNVVPPAYMFTGETPRPGEGLREAYGRMLTADRQFARATVNYLWKEMFGVGIVEPVNAFDLARLDPKKLAPGQTLQPTNPVLLEDLTDAFIASGYNLRSILRTIAISSSYQLSSKYTTGIWNEAWTPYFARHYPHRLQAEMLLDAITKATSVPATLQVQGMGTLPRAMQLPDTIEPNNRNQFGSFLDAFGRGDRDDTPRTNDSSIVQALSLLNNPIITTRVRRATANSTVAKVLASTSDPAAITDQLYLATLSRYPSAEEKAAAVGYLRSGSLQQRTEDLQFALINSLEFLFD